MSLQRSRGVAQDLLQAIDITSGHRTHGVNCMSFSLRFSGCDGNSREKKNLDIEETICHVLEVVVVLKDGD